MEIDKAAYDMLMSKVASLEHELRGKPAQPQGIDPAQFFNNLLINPKGTMAQYGLEEQHVEQVRTLLIADKLGPNAPLHMQVAANSGQSMTAVRELQQLVKTLADKVSNSETTHKKFTEREKFKAAMTDASKNPNLAKAFAKNPEKYIASLESQGVTAEEFIAKQEGELKEYAELFAPSAGTPAGTTPAASVNADNKTPSKQGAVLSAPLGGNLKDVPAPTIPSKPGAWNKDAFKDLKEKIVAQATAEKPPGA